MPRKVVKQRATLKAMKQVLLPELLRRRREELGFGLREMARLCKIDPTHLSQIEKGTVAKPNDETLTILANGYGLRRDDLALAVYGEYFEDVPTNQDVTGPLETAPPADSVGVREWENTKPTNGRRRLKAIAST